MMKSDDERDATSGVESRPPPKGALAADATQQLLRERLLYRRILELTSRDEIEPFLREALALIVEATQARVGFLELRDTDVRGNERAWSLASGCSEVQANDIQGSISRGVIAETLASGGTVETSSALLDARFSGRDSVRAHKIDAVLCCPIGDSAALGVLYLQGRRGPGPFSAEDREHAEIFARHLAPLADRVLVRRQVAENIDPMRELRERHRLEGLIGHSRALARALQQAMLAAPLDITLLLTGESGTGKTQLARLIHANSPRAGRPCVELNCAALPEALIESELFGAKAGSHSEARSDLAGKIQAADGGTLLLDEIGELPVSAQAKLLQFLQSKRYYPLGSTREVTADVRLIAATNRNLEAEARSGGFREDLFHRINVLPVVMPSLAERREDVPALARNACERAAEQHELPRLEMTPAALRAVAAAEWPGNVRQLEHAVQGAVIRAVGEAAAAVAPRHLFPDEDGATSSAGDEAPNGESFQAATRRFQMELLERTLADTDWNVSEAARRLDLSRSHTYELISALGLKRSG